MQYLRGVLERDSHATPVAAAR